jgi:hypothetical protein
MEPLSLVVVSISALVASAAKRLIGGLFSHFGRKTESQVVIVTAQGEKITLDASQLTPEKARAIVRSRSAA